MDEEDEELSELIGEGFNEIYFRIGELESNEGYADMVDFTAKIKDKKLQASLVNILSGGKRIFRRFKDELYSDREQLERYYLFIGERNRMRVLEWLNSIHVKVILDDKLSKMIMNKKRYCAPEEYEMHPFNVQRINNSIVHFKGCILHRSILLTVIRFNKRTYTSQRKKLTLRQGWR